MRRIVLADLDRGSRSISYLINTREAWKLKPLIQVIILGIHCDKMGAFIFGNNVVLTGDSSDEFL